MSDKQALIFDFDGLIIDTEAAEVAAWREEFAQVGLALDLDAYIATIGTNGPDVHRQAALLANRPGETRSEAQIQKDHNARSIEAGLKLPPLDGVLALLERAKAIGLLLAIGSSSDDRWVHTLVDGLGIKNQFDLIVTFDDVELAKPAPDIYLKVLEKLDVKPENALVLEDSYNGVIAAHYAGIRVVAVPTALTKHLDFSLAEEVLNSLADLRLEKYFSV